MAKIYLSAAAHATDNTTKCPTDCGENIHCNAYMDVVERRLKAHGIQVKRGDARLTGSQAMTVRVAEANRWGADIYYVAHTNAGGGRYSLTLCYPDKASKNRANVIHKYRKCVKSHKVRTTGELYEINATAMPCLYDELFFHDNQADCRWFHSGGMEALAEETVAALCELVGVKYKPLKEDKPVAGDTVVLKKGKLYLSSTGKTAVTRTGVYYLYDGVRIGGRYRVTNKPSRVGKKPVGLYVSGWVGM